MVFSERRTISRRGFLKVGAATGFAAWQASCPSAYSQIAGERHPKADAVRVLHPRMRTPVSIIIDDSTCLVNLNRFAIPQFAAAWDGQRYSQDWRSMPLEIPDAFVRKFADWADSEGVRGKYSVVPYPACVGRLDRELPGWTSRKLTSSIDLVRTRLTPGWDIHPEMVTHTRIIDTKTGHPYPHFGPKWMENWQWTDGKSAEQIAEYMAYALRILKSVDLPCEGITTPGGFGNRVLPELAQATLSACRDVYATEIPHYFRHLYDEGERSVAPRVEYASGLDGDDPRCVVSIIGCTGDWTGGWDCSSRGNLDRFIAPDLASGRLVEVIDRGEPAVLVCHWTGVYFNGEEVGLKIFQEVVRRLRERFDRIRWMKLSEIARYWAARELTRIELQPTCVRLRAPFACPAFTFQVARRLGAPLEFLHGDIRTRLVPVTSAAALAPGTYYEEEDRFTACIDLPKRSSEVRFG